jgi:hypothetical protein
MKKHVFYIYMVLLILAGCDEDAGSSSGKLDNSGGGTGVGGSTARFTIAGDYLYTVDNKNINAFDIGNAKQPVQKNSVSVQWQEFETIFAKDKYLYFGTRFGLHIYSIENPSNPGKISIYEHVYSCDPVVVDSIYAFVTMRNGNNCGRTINQLEVIDISNPYEPQSEAVYSMSNPYGLGIDGDLLFLCDNGLKVYDKSNVKDLELKQTFTIEANDVIPYDNILVVTGDDGIRQYNYSGSELTLLSSILTSK